MPKHTLSSKSADALAILPLITNKGFLRASKPKDGNAAYVWRMVGFYTSSDSKLQCMPICADWDVKVPADYHVEAPTDWLVSKCAETAKASETNYDGNAGFCIKEGGSVDGYHRQYWTKYGRRKHYIKTQLDPIVDEITNSVPLRSQYGVMRWGAALGAI